MPAMFALLGSIRKKYEHGRKERMFLRFSRLFLGYIGGFPSDASVILRLRLSFLKLFFVIYMLRLF